MQLAQGKDATFICFGTINLSSIAVVKNLEA